MEGYKDFYWFSKKQSHGNPKKKNNKTNVEKWILCTHPQKLFE